jgi:hypothetical protein
MMLKLLLYPKALGNGLVTLCCFRSTFLLNVAGKRADPMSTLCRELDDAKADAEDLTTMYYLQH